MPSVLTARQLPPRYRLIAALGEGSMGSVSRVYDRLTGQEVALKQVLLPDDLSADEVEQELLILAHEFRVLAGLRHPHIISVLDYGFDAERRPFYTMELLQDAVTVLEAGQALPLAGKIGLLLQALEALAYLHRRGVLHHDLKPANVLITAGRARLVDFGLAVLATQPREDDAFGTLQYLAPEVLDGLPYTEASDLYSLGVIAYELLVGRHPIQAETARDFLHRLASAPPDLMPLAEEPALADLIGRLLAKRPADRPSSAQVALAQLRQSIGSSASVGDLAIRESYLQAATFVGREHERAVLAEALAQAQQGRGSAWLLGGESGVGKSRLLDEQRTQALVAGFQVLRGQAVEGGGLPFQIWREPVRQLVLTSLLSDLDASVLREIVPDIDALIGRAVAGAPALPGEAHQQRLALTIAQLVARQQQPTLLLLEDLHWSDESLLPLGQLCRAADARPLLVLGSYRNDERPDLPSQLPDMATMSLARLSLDEIALLSQSMLGDAGADGALIDLLQRETEGNSFFLVEVVRALAESAGDLAQVGSVSLPRSVLAGGVRDVVRRRLSRVPAWARVGLARAAIIGRTIDQQLIGGLLSPERPREHWLQACADAAVLTVAENVWQFSHDKLRETLLADMAAGERAELHREVAQAIEQVYPGDSAWLGTLFEHWRQAGDVARGSYYAEAAARQLIGVSAYRQAAEIVEQGLALCEPAGRSVEQARLLTLLGDALERLGEYQRAVECYQRSIAIARRLGLQELVVDNLLGVGQVRHTFGDSAQASADLRAARELAEQLGDESRTARALQRLASHHQNTSTAALARGYYLEALQRYRVLGDAAGEASCLFGLGEMLAAAEHLDEAIQHLGAAQALYEQIGDRAGVVSVLNAKATLISYRDPVAAEAIYVEALPIARAIGDRKTSALLLNNLASIRMMDLSRYREARETFYEVLAIGVELNAPATICLAMLNLGVVHLEMGRFAEAQRYLERCQEQLQLLDAPRYRTFTRISLATAHRKQGRGSTALLHAEQALAMAHSFGQDYVTMLALLELGAVQLELGQPAVARQHIDAAQQLAVQHGFLVEQTIALSLLGRLALLEGQRELARRYHSEGVARARAAGNLGNLAEGLAHLALLGDTRDAGGLAAQVSEGLSIALQIESAHVTIHLLIVAAWLLTLNGHADRCAAVYRLALRHPSAEHMARTERLPMLVALMPELAALTGAPGDVVDADRELDQLAQQMLADLQRLSARSSDVQ